MHLRKQNAFRFLVYKNDYSQQKQRLSFYCKVLFIIKATDNLRMIL